MAFERQGDDIEMHACAHAERFCRKFSVEAICGMISLNDQRCCMRESDDGDQF
jgi:hypothetical protein